MLRERPQGEEQEIESHAWRKVVLFTVSTAAPTARGESASQGLGKAVCFTSDESGLFRRGTIPALWFPGMDCPRWHHAPPDTLRKTRRNGTSHPDLLSGSY